MVHLLDDVVFVIIALSVIPIACVGFLGGAVALVQAATQVQEASLTHLFRVVAIGALAALGGESAYRMLETLLARCLDAAGAV